MNLPPVHLTHCTGHLNAIQTGKVNLKVRKTTNCKSTACAGCCAAMKIRSEKSNCITSSSTITNFDEKKCKLDVHWDGLYTPRGFRSLLIDCSYHIDINIIQWTPGTVEKTSKFPSKINIQVKHNSMVFCLQICICKVSHL